MLRSLSRDLAFKTPISIDTSESRLEVEIPVCLVVTHNQSSHRLAASKMNLKQGQLLVDWHQLVTKVAALSSEFLDLLINLI